MIDTHTHLYLDDFLPEKEETMRRAIDAGVEKMIFPNVDLSTLSPMIDLHRKFPANTCVALGLHPTEVKESWENDLSLIKESFSTPGINCVAVGEIGIDLYWDKTFRKEQMDAFRRQVEWATAMNLPVIIHCRDGLDEVLDVLDSVSELPQGVFHSFGGSIEDVERIRRTGDFYFGLNGIVTFKNSKLREVLPAIGTDRIILETDSPYLTPVPHRGKRNESAYLPLVADTVARSFNLTVEEIERLTTHNATTLFHL